ncbi:MAG: DEAD/DEAH box helicase, partial [Planctomycetota bacterium]|nr:DEAD/DEAH box helicase [Planctomycetota bacterium]
MDSSSNNFSELGLCREILRAINEQGYKKTTPVQVQAIPAVLEGRDVLAAAQTGTGKTAAFTLPLLQRLSQHQQPASAKKPRALILVPTRELAIQVEESIAIYGRHLSLKMAVIYGGVNPNFQQRKLESGVDVVVATPGRLIDHMLQKNVGFGELEMVVIDEADRMLDMGFIADIRRIVNESPSRRQTLMFSATFLPAIKDLAADLLTKALEIQVSKPNMAAEKVRQVVNVVDRERKGELLLHLIETGHWFQLLVFTRTKHEASRLAQWLKRNKVPAAEI